MALNKYVLTATVTIPAATTSTATAGEPGTGGAAGFGNTSVTPGSNAWGIWPTTWYKGQVIMADPSGALFAAIGSGNLRAWVDGTDTVGHAALGN